MSKFLIYAAVLCGACAFFAAAATAEAADSPSSAAARAPEPRGEFDGLVLAVLDGDTLSVVRNGSVELVRLYGIDCPEMHQPFGREARRFTSDLTLQRKITVSIVKDAPRTSAAQASAARREVYADVLLPDGSNLNEALAGAGLAWLIPKGIDERHWKLLRLSTRAAASQRGLWRMHEPQAPWEFRTQEAQKRLPRAAKDPALNSQAGVFITRAGRFYHHYGCRYLDHSRKVVARADAAARGYKACPVCFPEKANPYDVPKLTLKGQPPEQWPEEQQPAEKLPPDLLPPEPPLESFDAMPEMPNPEPRLIFDETGVALGVTSDDMNVFPYASLIGLQDGDIIHMINGIWMDNLDTANEVFSSFATGGDFEIVVLRPDGPNVLYISLP